MNVKCHCSAPPSHPPSVIAWRRVQKSCCGIFAPKLGKARKIRSPLAAITTSDTAVAQCASRTYSGCSYAAAFGRPPLPPPRDRDDVGGELTGRRTSCNPGRPSSSARAELVDDAERHEVFRLLVPEGGRDLQAQRRAVAAIERACRTSRSRAASAGGGPWRVDRLVVVVGAADRDIARGGVRADQIEEVAQPGAAETADDVPAFDADVTRVLRDLRRAAAPDRACTCPARLTRPLTCSDQPAKSISGSRMS